MGCLFPPRLFDFGRDLCDRYFDELMRELLNYGLLFAGFGLAVLAIASLWIPKILGWKEKLSNLSPLMKELWWTYACYVWGSHCFFAVLALGFRGWFLSGSSSAAAMAGFICLWWSVRVYLQFFGFDLNEVADTRGNRIAKLLLTLLFLYLMIFFAIILWWNLGGAR